MYVTYLTTYTGNLLPNYYIGSTSEEKILSGKYFGSIRSKKWKEIFKKELKENPNLFSVQILSTHETRESALEEELKIHIEKDVVKSIDYMNESVASVNGFFGRSGSGVESPTFGRKHSDEAKKKMSDSKKGKTYDEIYGKEKGNDLRNKRKDSWDKNPISKFRVKPGKDHPNYGKKASDESRKKMSESHKGQIPWIKGKTQSESAKKKLSEINSGENHPRYKNIDCEKLIGLFDSGLKSKEVSKIMEISKSYSELLYKKIRGCSPSKYKKL